LGFAAVERINNFVQFYRQKRPKTGKKLKLEDAIPNKYELRLLIAICGELK